VEPAGLVDQIRAGPEHEVVRVGKDDLSTEPFDFAGMQCLDGRLRANWHEYRRLDWPVAGVDLSQPGTGFGISMQGGETECPARLVGRMRVRRSISCDQRSRSPREIGASRG